MLIQHVNAVAGCVAIRVENLKPLPFRNILQISGLLRDVWNRKFIAHFTINNWASLPGKVSKLEQNC